MVARFLILMVLLAGSAWPVMARQLCLECHPAHYVERGLCTGCHGGNPATKRREIAHQRFIPGRYARFTQGEVAEVQAGRRLLGQYACRRCHRINGEGNSLASDLDSAARRRTPQELADAIRRPVFAMPDFRIDTADNTAIVNALLASAAVSRTAPDRPRTVHFDSSVAGQDLFSKRCGGCHRLLSSRFGALGQGSVGPNLSGLMSPWYPPTFRDSGQWNRSRLGEWLRNPRAVRQWARMQPVMLTDRELELLLEIVGFSEVRQAP